VGDYEHGDGFSGSVVEEGFCVNLRECYIAKSSHVLWSEVVSNNYYRPILPTILI
jgi:hypothetical protein